MPRGVKLADTGTMRLAFLRKILIVITNPLLGIFSRKLHEDLTKWNPKKLLVISLTHIGDSILLLPFLKSMKNEWPSAAIDIVVKEGVQEIFVQAEGVEAVICYDAPWVTERKVRLAILRESCALVRKLRKSPYDGVFVTNYHVYSNLLAWLSGCPIRIGYAIEGDRFLNVIVPHSYYDTHAMHRPVNMLRWIRKSDIKVPELRINISTAADEWAEKMFQECNIYRAIGIHPGSGGRQKVWPAEKFAFVVTEVLKKVPKITIILFGNKLEERAAFIIRSSVPEHWKSRFINLCQITSIEQMAAVMKRCHLVLVNDSGPMHIAVAARARGVALFGPSDQKTWAPLSGNWITIIPRDGSQSIASIDEAFVSQTILNTC